MEFKRKTFLFVILAVISAGCAKNYVPQHNNVPVIVVTGNNSKPAAKSSAAPTTKPVARAMVKRAGAAPAVVPKVIWVSDKAAKKNFDGRLYYDLEGRRYWKNYIDGKYYLFNRAMYTNRAFKPK